ncbi:MAG: hypothetical protein Q4C99_11175, partial [Clostridia bacterium]|nr:hypothetical protein [Clostridia bacterium]
GYNLFEGSNPLLSAKNKKVRHQTDFFIFKYNKGIRTRREQSGRKQSGGLFLPTCQRAKRGDRGGSLGKIPCSPPKIKSSSSDGLFILIWGFEQ